MEHLSEVNENSKAKLLGEALDAATEKLLDTGKSPSRKVKELDNRGSHFYLAMYWARELAGSSDADLAAKFTPLADQLEANEAKIVDELNAVQGVAMDIGGYYMPTSSKAAAAMRPSETLNSLLQALQS